MNINDCMLKKSEKCINDQKITNGVCNSEAAPDTKPEFDLEAETLRPDLNWQRHRRLGVGNSQSH